MGEQKNKKGSIAILGALVLTVVFSAAKLIGFFPASWWWAISPTLALLPMLVIGATIHAFKESVREVIREENLKIRNELLLDINEALSSIDEKEEQP